MKGAEGYRACLHARSRFETISISIKERLSNPKLARTSGIELEQVGMTRSLAVVGGRGNGRPTALVAWEVWWSLADQIKCDQLPHSIDIEAAARGQWDNGTMGPWATPPPGITCSHHSW